MRLQCMTTAEQMVLLGYMARGHGSSVVALHADGVWFIEGRPVFDLREGSKAQIGESHKFLNHVFFQPTQIIREIPMKQCHQWCDVLQQHVIEELIVEFETIGT